jgi:hypothetical protein
LQGQVKSFEEMSVRPSLETGHRLGSHKSSKDTHFRAALGRTAGRLARSCRAWSAPRSLWASGARLCGTFRRFSLIVGSELRFVSIHDLPRAVEVGWPCADTDCDGTRLSLHSSWAGGRGVVVAEFCRSEDDPHCGPPRLEPRPTPAPVAYPDPTSLERREPLVPCGSARPSPSAGPQLRVSESCGRGRPVALRRVTPCGGGSEWGDREPKGLAGRA